MIEFPPDLAALLPDGSQSVASQWWATLPEADRQQLVSLWDERWEVSFFHPQTDDCGQVDEWVGVPIVEGGRFVPHDDDGRHEWTPGYFEYLLQNPELILAYDPTSRTVGGVCTQHIAARACLADGQVPAEFRCPFGKALCPMQAMRGVMLRRATQVRLTNIPTPSQG